MTRTEKGWIFATAMLFLNVALFALVPKPPTDIVAYSPDLGSVTLSWEAPPEDDLAGYFVYASQNQEAFELTLRVGEVESGSVELLWESPDMGKRIKIDDPLITSFNLYDLPLGRTYFVVSAYNEAGKEGVYGQRIEWVVR